MQLRNGYFKFDEHDISKNNKVSIQQTFIQMMNNIVKLVRKRFCMKSSSGHTFIHHMWNGEMDSINMTNKIIQRSFKVLQCEKNGSNEGNKLGLSSAKLRLSCAS